LTVDEGKGGLAGVVGQEEAARGGGATPAEADGAAAEEAFGSQRTRISQMAISSGRPRWRGVALSLAGSAMAAG
jgi:hypothetical protein